MNNALIFNGALIGFMRGAFVARDCTGITSGEANAAAGGANAFATEVDALVLTDPSLTAEDSSAMEAACFDAISGRYSDNMVSSAYAELAQAAVTIWDAMEAGLSPNPPTPTPPPVVVTTDNIDWSLGNVFSKILAAGANAITFSNVTPGQTIIVDFTGSAPGSTVDWTATGALWAGGTPPTQTTEGRDVYTFIASTGPSILGSYVQDLS